MVLLQRYVKLFSQSFSSGTKKAPNIKNYSYWNFDSLFRGILWCGVLKQNQQLAILYSEALGLFTWELGCWPSGKNTLVMTISPVESVCVSESTMTGLLGGWGLGVERLVAADRMFSSFSILSILSRFPLARISSTICIDSARLTGPLPDKVWILFSSVLWPDLASLFSVQSARPVIPRLPWDHNTPQTTHHTTTEIWQTLDLMK